MCPADASAAIAGPATRSGRCGASRWLARAASCSGEDIKAPILKVRSMVPVGRRPSRSPATGWRSRERRVKGCRSAQAVCGAELDGPQVLNTQAQRFAIMRMVNGSPWARGPFC